VQRSDAKLDAGCGRLDIVLICRRKGVEPDSRQSTADSFWKRCSPAWRWTSSLFQIWIKVCAPACYISEQAGRMKALLWSSAGLLGSVWLVGKLIMRQRWVINAGSAPSCRWRGSRVIHS